jgi:hypothetical protein
MDRALEIYNSLLAFPTPSIAITRITSHQHSHGNVVHSKSNSTSRASLSSPSPSPSLSVSSVIPLAYHHMCEGYRSCGKIDDMCDFINTHGQFSKPSSEITGSKSGSARYRKSKLTA